MDLVLSGQHGMNESRAIVYDSVGVGLGHYRYDSLLNEYVRDENGSYVAHTVLTGELDQGFRMDGRTRFSYDFSREKLNNAFPAASYIYQGATSQSFYNFSRWFVYQNLKHRIKLWFPIELKPTQFGGCENINVLSLFSHPVVVAIFSYVIFWPMVPDSFWIPIVGE